MAVQVDALLHTNDAGCRQTSQLNRLFGQKSISKSRVDRELRKEYVINCVIPPPEFINNHGSTTDEKHTATRADHSKDSHHTYSQSETRHVQKLQTSDNKQNNRSSLLPTQNSSYITNHENNYIRRKEVVLKTVKNIQPEHPSKETLKPKLRGWWKKIIEPGDYRYTQGQ